MSLTGTVAAGAGFTVELAGLAADNADATRLSLVGLTAENGIQVVVTPNELTTQPGTGFATMYSPGYTSLAFLDLDAAAETTALGGIQAKSIDSLVINGAISADTKNPYDTSVTNDFRGVISVTGRIGSVVGLRSSLSGAIRADSIVSAAGIGDISADGFDETFVAHATTAIGAINAGSGDFAGRFQAHTDIGLITGVSKIDGSGIIDGKVRASGDIGGMTVKAFNATAIQGGTFQSRGNFGGIYAEATKGGNAIDGAVFTAPGRIVPLDPANPPPDTDACDPKGDSGTIGNVLVRNRSSAQPDLGTGIENSAFLAGAAGGIGDIAFTNLASGAAITLTLAASSVGNLTVGAPGSLATADLVLGGTVGGFRNVNVDGNATLDVPSVTKMGDLSVGGTLTLPKGLPSLAQMGTFSAGSPNAIVGSSGRNATSKGATIDVVRLFKTAAAQPAPTATPVKKKKR